MSYSKDLHGKSIDCFLYKCNTELLCVKTPEIFAIFFKLCQLRQYLA